MDRQRRDPDQLQGLERSFGSGDEWADPSIAIRYRGQFAENWFATAMVDVGGFGVSSEFTWQALATVGHEVNDQLSFQGSYRFLEVDRDEGNGEIEVEMSGPVVGRVYRF